MAFSMAGGGSSNPEINITPLIDILLVLIIIFIVIDTWTPRHKGLEAEVPQPSLSRKPASCLRRQTPLINCNRHNDGVV